MLQLKCGHSGCQAGGSRTKHPNKCIYSRLRENVGKSPRRQPLAEPSTSFFSETTIRRCCAALPLAALVTLAYTPLVEASELSTVPLRRAVVEDMLVQRFTERVKSLSDQEVAALLERLLSTDTKFPEDILIPAPRISLNQSAVQQQRNSSSAAALSNVDDIEEEADDTTALLEGLQDTATDVIVGQAAETVGGAAFSALGLSNVLNNPSIIFGSRAAKAIGMTLGVSAAVPVAMAAAKKRGAKNKAANEGRDDSKSITNEVKDSSKGPLGWLTGLLKESAPSAEDQPSGTASANRTTTTAPELTTSSPSRPDQVSPVSSAKNPPLDQSTHASAAQGINGQVLWRRKEESQRNNADTNEVSDLIRGSGGSSNLQGEPEGVLWQRKETIDENEDGLSRTSNRVNALNGSTSQSDLWRMPMDQLRGISEAALPASGRTRTRATAAVPPGSSLERSMRANADNYKEYLEDKATGRGSTMGRGGGFVPTTGRGGRSNRQKSSVLDNAEPAEFAIDRE